MSLEMGRYFVRDRAEESRDGVVAGKICCRCNRYSAFLPDEPRVCKHCNHDEDARIRAAKLAANSPHVAGTKHMSTGVAKKFAMNKKYYESRADDIRSGKLELDIPRGAPDAPELPKKFF